MTKKNQKPESKNSELVKTLPIVFIVGSGRCGSHWLLDLLLGHPQIIGELQTESKVFKLFEPYLRVTKDKSFIRKVKNLILYCYRPRTKTLWREIFQKYQNFEEGTRMKKFIREHEFKELIYRAQSSKSNLYDQLTFVIQEIYIGYYTRHKISDSSTLVEKTPGHLSAVDLILEIFPSAKIIEMIRDGRDVCKSFDGLYKEGVEWAENNRLTQIKYWKKSILLGQHYRSNPDYKSKIHLLKYEDLNSDFKVTLQKVFSFLGLKLDSTQWTKVEANNQLTNTSKHSQSGTWQELLSKDDLDMINKIAGDQLRELGYLKP